MATRYDATKLFVPISAVKKGEVSVAPDHHYNTRLAAQKRQQQLSGHAQPSQEIEYNKHMAQLQDSNRTDMQHGERITRSGPNVDRSQKPNKQLLLSDRGHPVPGHVKRVVQHDYEPMPGPAKEPQSNPNMETMSKPIKLSLDQPKLDNIPDHSPAIMDENPYNLEKGSMIEFSNPTQYGVIKWIGYLTDISKCKVAGVEMVSNNSSYVTSYHRNVISISYVVCNATFTDISDTKCEANLPVNADTSTDHYVVFSLYCLLLYASILSLITAKLFVYMAQIGTILKLIFIDTDIP